MNTTETLLKGSIELEAAKKHLSNMLDEWEAQFETGTEFSDASKEEYLAAAKFMKKLGRPSGAMKIIEATL